MSSIGLLLSPVTVPSAHPAFSGDRGRVIGLVSTQRKIYCFNVFVI